MPEKLSSNLGVIILGNEEFLGLLTQAFTDLMICGFQLVTRGFELVSCRFELVTRGFELVACGFELVTGGFEFALLNFNSYF